jgi:hypothetical protein
MKMKHELRRMGRRILRNIARFILGFETCPRGYRKNFLHLIGDALMYTVAGFALIVGFLAMALALSC